MPPKNIALQRPRSAPLHSPLSCETLGGASYRRCCSMRGYDHLRRLQ
jgi:hypothetical protein